MYSTSFFNSNPPLITVANHFGSEQLLSKILSLFTRPSDIELILAYLNTCLLDRCDFCSLPVCIHCINRIAT